MAHYVIVVDGTEYPMEDATQLNRTKYRASAIAKKAKADASVTIWNHITPVHKRLVSQYRVDNKHRRWLDTRGG